MNDECCDDERGSAFVVPLLLWLQTDILLGRDFSLLCSSAFIITFHFLASRMNPGIVIDLRASLQFLVARSWARKASKFHRNN